MDLDLDGFDLDPTISKSSTDNDAPDTQSAALRCIDDKWYRERNRRARQMDLIGDYAGTEPFVLDGNHHLSSMI